jgi:hypothetical protein
MRTLVRTRCALLLPPPGSSGIVCPFTPPPAPVDAQTSSRIPLPFCVLCPSFPQRGYANAVHSLILGHPVPTFVREAVRKPVCCVMGNGEPFLCFVVVAFKRYVGVMNVLSMELSVSKLGEGLWFVIQFFFLDSINVRLGVQDPM